MEVLHQLGPYATNHLWAYPSPLLPLAWKSGHWRQEQELQQVFGGNSLGLTSHLSNTYLFVQHWIKGETNGHQQPPCNKICQVPHGTSGFSEQLQKGKKKDFKLVSNKNKAVVVLQMSRHPQLLLSSLMISNVIWQRESGSMTAQQVSSWWQAGLWSQRS